MARKDSKRTPQYALISPQLLEDFVLQGRMTFSVLLDEGISPAFLGRLIKAGKFDLSDASTKVLTPELLARIVDYADTRKRVDAAGVPSAAEVTTGVMWGRYNLDQVPECVLSPYVIQQILTDKNEEPKKKKRLSRFVPKIKLPACFAGKRAKIFGCVGLVTTIAVGGGYWWYSKIHVPQKRQAEYQAIRERTGPLKKIFEELPYSK